MAEERARRILLARIAANVTGRRIQGDRRNSRLNGLSRSRLPKTNGAAHIDIQHSICNSFSSSQNSDHTPPNFHT